MIPALFYDVGDVGFGLATSDHVEETVDLLLGGGVRIFVNELCVPGVLVFMFYELK